MEELGAIRWARNLDQLRMEAGAALAAAGVPTAWLDGEVLLAAACGIDRAGLYARGRESISERFEADFRTMLARRIAREPLAYIIGRQEFWSLDFVVTRDVLIPRPETELLVELALGRLSGKREEGSPPYQGGVRGGSATARQRPPPSPLLGKEGGRSLNPDPLLAAYRRASDRPLLCDLGTGSGCIAVALARELPSAEVWALDLSPAALPIAATNARRHSVAERIRFIESDLFAAVGAQRFDAVIANPPYVSGLELERVQPEVRWEPRLALDGGGKGLAVIQRLLHVARRHLVDGGWLLMEIGAQQEAAVTAMAHAALLTQVSVRRDYAGLPRVLVARR